MAYNGKVKLCLGRIQNYVWFPDGITTLMTGYSEFDAKLSGNVEDDEGWNTYEYVFTADKATLNRNSVAVTVINNSSASISFGIDDIEIYEERAKTEQE